MYAVNLSLQAYGVVQDGSRSTEEYLGVINFIENLNLCILRYWSDC